MADASGITIAVETAVHNAARDLALHVLNEHGIRIHEMRFDWIVTQSVDGTERSDLRATELVTRK